MCFVLVYIRIYIDAYHMSMYIENGGLTTFVVQAAMARQLGHSRKLRPIPVP